MKRINAFLSFILILSTLLAACGPAAVDDGPEASSIPPDSGTQGDPNAAQAALDSDEDHGFVAQVTSAISVDLTWEPVEGATGYRIENQFGDSEWFTLAEVAGDQLAYEDFLTPSNTELNYRLTPLVGTDAGKALTTIVTTPEVVPNPYRVIAKLEEPDYSDIGLEIPGFDPETFDPSTFDPSTLDFSALDPENLDLSSLGPKPVSALEQIGPEGGTLSVTGKNGVIYTLDVPPDALPFPVFFVMTPIAEIDGYPFSGGWDAAVSIQPEGIYFDIPATLTFKIPVDEGTEEDSETDLLDAGFAFEAGGSEFHLVPLQHNGTSEARVPSANGKMARPATAPPHTIFRIDSTTLERSGSRGSGPVRTSEGKSFNQSNPSRRASDRAASRSALEVHEAAQRGKARQWAEEIRQKLAANGTSAFVDAVFGDFASFYMSSFYNRLSEDEKERLWAELIRRTNGHLNAWDCPSDESAATQQLVRRLRQPKSGFDKEYARRFLAAYGQTGKGKLDALTAVKSCAVDLVISSTATIEEIVCRADFLVRATVPLRWHWDGEAFLQGSARLIYEPIRVGQGYDPRDEICEQFEYTGLEKATVTIVSLKPVFSGKTHKDWTMKKAGTPGFQVAGEVHEFCYTVYVPRDRTQYGGCVANRGGTSDPWGGLVSLLSLQSNVWPGASTWKISGSAENPIVAEWSAGRFIRGGGDGWRGQHWTVFTLTTR